MTFYILFNTKVSKFSACFTLITTLQVLSSHLQPGYHENSEVYPKGIRSLTLSLWGHLRLFLSSTQGHSSFKGGLLNTLLPFWVLIIIPSSCPFKLQGYNSVLLCDFHKSSLNIFNVSLLKPSQRPLSKSIFEYALCFQLGPSLTYSSFTGISLKELRALFLDYYFRNDQFWIHTYQIIGLYT